MEAKDTVLSSKQVDEVEKLFEWEELATQRVVDAYLLGQAEVSFKAGQADGRRAGIEEAEMKFNFNIRPQLELEARRAGRREVVEWVDNAMGEHPGNNFHVLYKRTWQAYKKSLGVQEN